MSATSFDKGCAVRMAATFRVGDTPTDPSTVKLFVLAPDGTRTLYVYGVDPGLINDTTGTYHRDVDLEVEGYWRYRWEGSGVAQAAYESDFTVRDSSFY